MPKIRKVPKKSLDPTSNRKPADWVVEIGPVPSFPEQPGISGNETIEIEKWLQLVQSYWKKGTRDDRKSSRIMQLFLLSAK